MGKLRNSENDWRWMLPLGAIVAAAVFFFPLLLNIPLLDPDEGLHASIAQEMVERGDWVTPRLVGEPFLDKPILYFWAEALSLKLFGMHEAAVRFAGLMFGLLGAVTTAVVGWRMFGRAVGMLSGLFYATTLLPLALAQAAAHDVALVPWISLAVLLFWESDRAETRRAAAACTLAIGVLLGLTMLTKGLVGVALVGVAYGCYLLLGRRLTLAACLRGAGALAFGALVASPWYIAMELNNPGYNYYYFVQRHFLGFATATQTHGQEPWWYYLPIVLLGGLPWIAYLPATVQDAWARWKAGDRDGSGGAILLLWCWLIACLLFLSISRSKLVTYLWPVFPAVAVLAAVVWVRLMKGTLHEGARRFIGRTLLFSCLSGPAVLPVMMLVVRSEFSVRFSWPAWTAAILAGAASLLPLGFWLAGRIRATLGAAVLSLSLQFAVVMAVMVPRVAPTYSAQNLATHFNRTRRLPREVLIVDERVGSLVFYLQGDLRSQLRSGQVRKVRSGELSQWEPDAVIVVPEKRVARVSRFDPNGSPHKIVDRWRLYQAPDLRTVSAHGRDDTRRR